MLLTGDFANCRAALGNDLDPAQVVAHDGWCRARRQVLERIASKAGPIAVLGEPGTGKTALLHHLTSHLERVGYQVNLTDRGDLKADFVEDEIVLLDEADKLAKPVLDRLLQQAPVCVCAGLPSFAQSLDGSSVNISFAELAPLSPDETRSFIAERLTKAGWSADQMADDAVATIVCYSAGTPRIINLLLRSAFLIAAGDGADRVTGKHVDQAVAIRGEIDRTVADWAGDFGALSEPRASPVEHGLDNRQAACANGLTTATDAGAVIGRQSQEAPPAVKAADARDEEDHTSNAAPIREPAGERDAVRPPASTKSEAVASDLDRLFRTLRQSGSDGSPCTKLSAVKRLNQLPRRVKAAGAAIVCALLVGIWTASQHTSTQSALSELRASSDARVANDQALSKARPEATASISPESENTSDPGAWSKAPQRLEQGVAQASSAPDFVLPKEPDGSAAKALPPGAATRVVLTYRRADTGAEAKALNIAARLRSRGVFADPTAVSPGESGGQILYFFSEDRDAAVDVQKSLAGKYSDPRLAKLSSKTLPTRPGTVEVSVLP